MINRTSAHGARRDEAFRVEGKEVSAHDIIGETSAVHGRDELDVLFGDLQCRRNGWIAAVGKKHLGLQPGSSKTLDHRKGLADIRPGRPVHFIVGDDLGLGIVARLGNMEAVSLPLLTT